MNETYDKLIDIIAVDIKLAIELIKGQDIDVWEFIKYMFNNIKYPDLPKIDTMMFKYYSYNQNGIKHVVKEHLVHNINPISIKLLSEYNDIPNTLYNISLMITRHLNKLKNEQN